MRSLSAYIVAVISISCLALALADETLPCSDGSSLLPFVTKQLQPGSSLIVFQGTAAPQYACVAASWSAQTQALEVDVKIAESVAEVMRLAAPCASETEVSTYPCAAGINTSTVFVFSENSMLDAMVRQVSDEAIRVLPFGVFAFLVTKEEFFKYVGGVRGDGADLSHVSDNSSSYHMHNRNLFTEPSLQVAHMSWPFVVSNSFQHSSWLLQAAVDAWLNIVPFPYILDAHAVVDARQSISFSPNASDATYANGRQCTLASIHIDRSLHLLKTKEYAEFASGAWFGVDLSSVCLFSALNLRLKHPSRDRIEASLPDIYWNLHKFDRTPLAPMAGCDEYVAQDGKRLTDLYGHLPGYWIHPNLVVATFEKNVTKCSGEPTDTLVKVRGIKTTKKLKAGKTIARIPKVGGLFSPEQLSQSEAWPAMEFMTQQRADLNMIYTVGLAYEMLNSAKSPWKPLICNFPSSYNNFLQLQDVDVLEQCSAEVSVVNPGFNATKKVQHEIMQSSVQLQGIVAAVIALFPKIFPTGLPAKYFMHARLAVLSRAWGSDGHSVLCPIADLFNHEEPTHTVISIRKNKGKGSKGKSEEGDLSVVEVILERTADKDSEVFNGYARKTCIPSFLFNFGYAPMEARNNTCPPGSY